MMKGFRNHAAHLPTRFFLDPLNYRLIWIIGFRDSEFEISSFSDEAFPTFSSLVIFDRNKSIA